MTAAERAKRAVDGMRIRNDELGRGPSHDEVQELLERVIDEAETDAFRDVHALDGHGTVSEQFQHLAVEIVQDLKHRYEKLRGLKKVIFEYGFEGQLFSYGFDGQGYSESVKAEQRADVVNPERMK